MSNEIVRYDNAFNMQPLRKFNNANLNLLLSICSKLRGKKEAEVTFSFHEIRLMANINKNLTTDELTDKILELNAKLLATTSEIRTEHEIIQFALFSYFKINKDNQTLSIKLNSDYSYLVNGLVKGFTRFQLEEFKSLRSTYSKELYRRLKQYRSTGIFRIKISELRHQLSVPSSYKASQLFEKVINPAVAELSPIIGLRYEKIYSQTGKRGRPRIDSIKFIFEKETIIKTNNETNKNSEENKKMEEFKNQHEGLTPWQAFKKTLHLK